MAIHDNDEIDLIAFLRKLWDLKYIVVITTALFIIAAVFIAIMATPKYQATVVVTKANDNGLAGAASLASQFGSLGRIAGLNVGKSGPGREVQAVLESRHLAERFVQRNDLQRILLSGDESMTLWRAVELFRQTILSVREDETEGLTSVSIVWTDPSVAAQWANNYVGLANELIRTQALEESERNIEYLNKQIEQTNIVEMQRVMYNLIETETKTLMLANARAEYAFAVVDPAVAPEVRSSPRRKLIVLSGGAIGVFFGVLIVFVVNIVRQVRDESSSKPANTGHT